MLHGYKRENNDVFYFRKDHFCPECKTKLDKVPVSKVVNSGRPKPRILISVCREVILR